MTKRSGRQIVVVLGCFILLAVVGLVACNLWVVAETKARVYASVAEVPAQRVGLLLGTGKTIRGGRSNPHFVNRVQAAAQLYRVGQIERVLVSGDNHAKGY